MTNHWNDIANSDVILIMGSNAAETHPISFKWVLRAMEKRGATLIHVDPRYTRTSAKAHIYAPLRAGTDIAFFGGLINYILTNNLQYHDYVANYTNAAFIVGKDYGFKDGLFSGFDPATGKYDRKAWAFESDDKGVPKRDKTLKNPRCVLQLMKQHYSRYTPDKVSEVTGTPQDLLLKIYKTFAATGKPDKAGTWMYALGQTQHTVGTQNIRCMAMVQLLLGNIGIAGGGVNALRGESNVQGATDHALLYHIWPGYLPTPTGSVENLAAYDAKYTPKSADPMSANWWSNFPKYSASFLKSMYPSMDPAKAFDLMPKLDDGQDASWLTLFHKMSKGQFKGSFIWGQNPACSSANAGKTRQALAKQDWMVCVNIFQNETANFWKGPGVDPKTVPTEVFFLPCAVSIEKEGSITNSGRWMQWRIPGPKPMGEAHTDGHIMCDLAAAIKDLYARRGGPLAEAVLGMDIAGWTGPDGYDANKIGKIVNGWVVSDFKAGETAYKAGSQAPGFAMLQADGSTACGNWIYSGSYTDKGNMCLRRDKTQTPMQAKIGLYPGWTWSWPANRRILYNRASVDAAGKPRDPSRAVIAWEDGKWVGDVPDGGYKPGDKYPFIMLTEGHAQLFGPGRTDGPFPEHYEPMETPLKKNPLSKVLNNPIALHFPEEYKAVADPKFPMVCTTFRVTEHWQTGALSRQTPWLVETQPQVFLEISPQLAREIKVKNGDKLTVESARGSIWAVAMVTERMVPLTVMGKRLHQVGLSWQFGWFAPKNGGDAANLLSPSVGDANASIPETKSFMVNVRKA